MTRFLETKLSLCQDFRVRGVFRKSKESWSWFSVILNFELRFWRWSFILGFCEDSLGIESREGNLLSRKPEPVFFTGNVWSVSRDRSVYAFETSGSANLRSDVCAYALGCAFGKLALAPAECFSSLGGCEVTYVTTDIRHGPSCGCTETTIGFFVGIRSSQSCRNCKCCQFWRTKISS